MRSAWLLTVACTIAALVAPYGCSASTGPSNQIGGQGGNAQGGAAGNGTAATGNSGGTINVTGGNGGSINVTGGNGGGGNGGSNVDAGGPVTIDDCIGKVDGPTQAALEAGGGVDPAMKWLYPYDKTVFPGGLAAPLLMWAPQGGGTDAVLVHMTSQLLDYKVCFGPTAPARITIPPNMWATAFAKNLGTTDPLFVSITTKKGGAVSGPITEQWLLANGSLKGTVYYNTYDSPKAGGVGAVMRIRPGAAQPDAFLTATGGIPLTGPCISCHVVSADGSRMIAATHNYLSGVYDSSSYDIQGNTNPNPPKMAQNLDEAAFSALYPDGSRFMTNGSPTPTTSGLTPPIGVGNVPGMRGARTSRMFSTQTGQQIAVQGWNVQYAKTPMFSRDGTKLAFNHHENSNGHTLSMMDFDAATNTFSNGVVLYNNPSAFPAWPTFTPDGQKVIFWLGSSSRMCSPTPWEPGITGDLYILDVGSLQATPLARANGFDGSASYLPAGARDQHLQYYPTMAPTAAGGYYWVYFTSRRTYGNLIQDASAATKTKKIWVTAIDIGAPSGIDASHPAFYLPGQEEASGNIRAFAALDPCLADSRSCLTGTECCTGYCVNGLCGPQQTCSALDDRCTTSSDCCDPAQKCLGGFCEFDIPR